MLGLGETEWEGSTFTLAQIQTLSLPLPAVAFVGTFTLLTLSFLTCK